MDYLHIGLDAPVSIFDIAQAHAQLESDYNVGGWLRERPSNQRRRESTGCQLSRLGHRIGARWVDICGQPDEADTEGDADVRDIYMLNVLKWSLPIDADLMACIQARYTPEFLATYAQCRGRDYLQAH